MQSLTPKQQLVLDFIEAYIALNNYSPSFEEIRVQIGASSINSAKQFVDQLISKGHLQKPKEKNQSRFLRLTQSEAKGEPRKIKLVGSVAAGYPIEAVETREHIDVPQALLKPDREYFALRVRGDSMIDDCIMDGDVVVIRREQSAANGQTVVALVANDATIKRFYKKKSHIELHPANPKYNVIKVESDAEFKILGVLASVIRKLE